MRIRVVYIDKANDASIAEWNIENGPIWDLLIEGASYVIVGFPDGSTKQYSPLSITTGPGEWPEDP